MNVPKIILEQLGGQRFIVTTGSSHFVGDGCTLRMNLSKNISKANRLFITLDADDTYTMRFFHYTAPRFNTKTYTFTEEKVKNIKEISGVYCDMLSEIFEQTTGLYTRLF